MALGAASGSGSRRASPVYSKWARKLCCGIAASSPCSGSSSDTTPALTAAIATSRPVARSRQTCPRSIRGAAGRSALTGCPPPERARPVGVRLERAVVGVALPDRVDHPAAADRGVPEPARSLATRFAQRGVHERLGGPLAALVARPSLTGDRVVAVVVVGGCFPDPLAGQQLPQRAHRPRSWFRTSAVGRPTSPPSAGGAGGSTPPMWLT